MFSAFNEVAHQPPSLKLPRGVTLSTEARRPGSSLKLLLLDKLKKVKSHSTSNNWAILRAMEFTLGRCQSLEFQIHFWLPPLNSLSQKNQFWKHSNFKPYSKSLFDAHTFSDNFMQKSPKYLWLLRLSIKQLWITLKTFGLLLFHLRSHWISITISL